MTGGLGGGVTGGLVGGGLVLTGVVRGGGVLTGGAVVTGVVVGGVVVEAGTGEGRVDRWVVLGELLSAAVAGWCTTEAWGELLEQDAAPSATAAIIKTAAERDGRIEVIPTIVSRPKPTAHPVGAVLP